MTTCPTCHGPVHRDMSGAYWTTRSDSEVAKRIRDLHLPEWIEARCERPRKGCGREDCTRRDSTMWGANQYVHLYGFQVCAHCTSGGDPYHFVSDEFPCPTLQALEGDPA